MSENLLLLSTIRKFRIVQIEGIGQVRRFVFEEGESTSKATIKQYLMVQQEGRCQIQHPVKYYNLAPAGMTTASVKRYLTVRGRGCE